MANSILALCRHAPYGNTLAREGLEAILACAAMDQIPAVLFTGDGVYQLLEQDPQAINEKSLRRNLQAMPMFGIEHIHVCEKSAETRGIATDALQLAGAEIVLLADTGAFIRDFDQVLSF
ncbi:sulfurtransferase complex subunit TusC [Microbulbifer agarilyticus]|uniref:sulfurtransferase complex subunit TusC n=1 Tax=Microbulbifer agarilyticus TaxID=260552 RepID=UPI001C938594|nr:sulfurtransferase complex subunit TusC [Microbulbifer agarilyticus]MBY6210720.1 sulfurtransferase complex subunit TusC [Microbulbifer agarilyticus]